MALPDSAFQNSHWRMAILHPLKINHALFRPGPVDWIVNSSGARRSVALGISELASDSSAIRDSGSARRLRWRPNRISRRARAIRVYPCAPVVTLGAGAAAASAGAGRGLCALPNTVLCRDGRRGQRPERAVSCWRDDAPVSVASLIRDAGSGGWSEQPDQQHHNRGHPAASSATAEPERGAQ